MGKIKDLTGLRFFKLLVISRAPNIGEFPAWNCVCDCGISKIIIGDRLRTGNNKSCGCLSKSTCFKKTHGLITTKEYHSWQSMKRRCKLYPTYIAKGISVCDRWLNSFEAFLEDMGPCPPDKHSIDRKENDKGYYKDNCRWADTEEQNNNYDQNRIIEYNGESMNVTQWASKLNIPRHRIYQRLNKGWTPEKALTYNS